MPITAVDTDLEHLTVTVEAEFAAPLARLWNAYADPRQIERFWGPPDYPAVFTRHDMFTGGRSHYCMIGPDGDEHHGYWKYLNVEPMASFEVLDGFALADGSPNPEMPSMRMTFALAATDSGSRLVSTTYFNSADELQQLIEMGMLEGTKAAMGQLDAVLADLTSFAADTPAEAQLLDATRVRVSRVIRGTVDQVWRAHHDAELLPRWLLGPDGWEMASCEVAANVGDTYRYVWRQVDGTEQFGFTGELLESTPPHRSVTTEAMIGMDGPGTVNELTLRAFDGGALLCLVITYPSEELRDMILSTGMVDGMEASYARLEATVLAE